MLDTVEVLSHHKFRDLLKSAGVLLHQTLGQRAEGAAALADPVIGVRRELVALEQGGAGEAATASREVLLAVPTGHRADPNQFELFGQLDDEAPGEGVVRGP